MQSRCMMVLIFSLPLKLSDHSTRSGLARIIYLRTISTQITETKALMMKIQATLLKLWGESYLEALKPSNISPKSRRATCMMSLATKLITLYLRIRHYNSL